MLALQLRSTRIALVCAWGAIGAAVSAQPIDRQALVSRHNPVIRSVDVDSPFSVGNGQFAFTADVTGLQTFSAHYQREGIPTETAARWAWHSEPNPSGYKLDDANRPFTEADGRVVAYPTNASGPAGLWLRRNPHDVPLGQLSFEADKKDGTPLWLDDIRDPQQSLDLWRGVITSRFVLEGVPILVTTSCHPTLDLVAVRVESDLIAAGKLRVRLGFPHGHDLEVKNGPGLDWSGPERHQTTILSRTANRVNLERRIDETRYFASVSWPGLADLSLVAPHQYRLAAGPAQRALAFTVAFGLDPGGRRFPRSMRRSRRAPRPGRSSGRAARSSTSRAAATRARPCWSGAWCSRSI